MNIRLKEAQPHYGHRLCTRIVPPATDDPSEAVVATYFCSCGSSAVTRGGVYVQGDSTIPGLTIPPKSG